MSLSEFGGPFDRGGPTHLGWALFCALLVAEAKSEGSKKPSVLAVKQTFRPKVLKRIIDR